MGLTLIQWTDRTWSPLRVRVRQDAAAIAEKKGYTSLIHIAARMAGHVGPHCERVSSGCINCYAESGNHRCLPVNGTGLPYDRRARDLVDPFVDQNILGQPLSWKKPCKVFVENQSDLFGEWVELRMIDEVFAMMAMCPHITFQVLTKRAATMLEYLIAERTPEGIMENMRAHGIPAAAIRWPLPNVWIGVSAEDQKTWDDRTAFLETSPAAVRFISLEPQLAYVDVAPVLRRNNINWLIQGGESGAGARPFDIAWPRHAAAQCKASGVALFVKQLGAIPMMDESHWYQEINHPGGVHIPLKPKNAKHLPAGFVPLAFADRKGGDWDEWPPILRVRDFPILGAR